jgi:hypothetical protein
MRHGAALGITEKRMTWHSGIGVDFAVQLAGILYTKPSPPAYSFCTRSAGPFLFSSPPSRHIITAKVPITPTLVRSTLLVVFSRLSSDTLDAAVVLLQVFLIFTDFIF